MVFFEEWDCQYIFLNSLSYFQIDFPGYLTLFKSLINLYFVQSNKKIREYHVIETKDKNANFVSKTPTKYQEKPV